MHRLCLVAFLLVPSLAAADRVTVKGTVLEGTVKSISAKQIVMDLRDDGQVEHRQRLAGIGHDDPQLARVRAHERKAPLLTVTQSPIQPREAGPASEAQGHVAGLPRAHTWGDMHGSDVPSA